MRDYPNVKLEHLPDRTYHVVGLDADEDPALRYEIVNTRALPVRDVGVTVNYPMEICAGSAVGHTPYNGATRQIPGTSGFGPHNGKPIPSLDEEPLWMKMSVTSPAPAGMLCLNLSCGRLAPPRLLPYLNPLNNICMGHFNLGCCMIRDNRAWHGGISACQRFVLCARQFV